MQKLIELHQDAVVLSPGTVDALVARGSGDAALLYLYLLRHNGFYDPQEVLRDTHWERLRLDSALLHLQELGLVGQDAAPPPMDAVPAVPDRENAPDYSTADITEALEQPDTEFSQLLHLVEGALGKKLGVRDLKLLYELLDYLALPPDVILTLVQWQIECYEKQYGPGRRPSMTAIRTKAYYWKQRGIDNLDAVETFLKKEQLMQTQIGQLMAACRIVGREPTDGERQHLNRWVAWGFPPETVAYAYDITVTNTGRFSWSYCNKILQSWHEKGLHTLSQARSERQPASRKGGKRPVPNAPAPAQPKPEPTAEEKARQAEQSVKQTQWIMDFLKNVPQDGAQEGHR
ncbi:MAG: DnaD domain protein [Clostridiales bacterium]|nr:DnaD domain protein [Clostridiales bacterium]